MGSAYEKSSKYTFLGNLEVPRCSGSFTHELCRSGSWIFNRWEWEIGAPKDQWQNSESSSRGEAPKGRLYSNKDFVIQEWSTLISNFLSRMEQMIKIIMNMTLQEGRVSLKSTETLCRYCWLLWIKWNSRRFHFESTRYESENLKKNDVRLTHCSSMRQIIYIFTCPFHAKAGPALEEHPICNHGIFYPTPYLFFLPLKTVIPFPLPFPSNHPLFVSFITTNQHTLYISLQWL